jgi:hypothetical protein
LYKLRWVAALYTVSCADWVVVVVTLDLTIEVTIIESLNELRWIA